MLAGVWATFSRCARLRPSTMAPASAASPADMWTTVPPAKSFTPQLKKRPS